jgi:NAD-dependent SIR2 family protein deacetylase
LREIRIAMTASEDGAYQAFDENEVNQPRRSLLMDNYRNQFSPEDRRFVLSGAGISAESGLATFRGSGGLWNGHRVEEVATPEAWDADPELVWRFYSMRRREDLAAQPNAAHLALATVEQSLGGRFYLCTQNVDDLHERAGSGRTHHNAWNALPIPMCSL